MHSYSSISVPTAPSDQGFDKAIAACEKSVAALRRSHLDLYLIHWPGAQGRKREDPQNAILRRESWRALEQLYSEGRQTFSYSTVYIVKFVYMCINRKSEGNRCIKLYTEALGRIANVCHS